MAIEVLQNEEISGGKNGGRKVVGFANRRGRANRGGEHIKKRERGGVVLPLDPSKCEASFFSVDPY